MRWCDVANWPRRVSSLRRNRHMDASKRIRLRDVCCLVVIEGIADGRYWLRDAFELNGAALLTSYVVVGFKQEEEQTGSTHLRLELDPERMSQDERQAAAAQLRRALSLLEKDGQK
jgi:hypothetical protein